MKDLLEDDSVEYKLRMIKALNSLIRTDPFRTEMLAIYLVNALFDESPMVRKEALQAIANLEKGENPAVLQMEGRALLDRGRIEFDPPSGEKPSGKP